MPWKPCAWASSQKGADVSVGVALVVFDRQQVVSLLVHDVLGDVLLTAHGINGDDAPLEDEHVQQAGNRGDFVLLALHIDHSQSQLAAGGPRGQRMNRPIPVQAAASQIGRAHV